MEPYRGDLASSYAAVGDDRRETVFPLLLDRIRRHAPEGRLLDYGGGSGELARLCTALPLATIVTYDLSPEMTELAARESSGHRRVQVAGTTESFSDGFFDVVTCNGVWMCWGSEGECESNLTEITRLLAPDGILLAAVTHPCFRNQPFATYRTDFDLSHYLENGREFRVRMFDGAREVELKDTHWSLGAMSRQLKRVRLRIEEITEVADRAGAPGSPWMILEARRTGP